jgi:hypothetical protein
MVERLAAYQAQALGAMLLVQSLWLQELSPSLCALT